MVSAIKQHGGLQPVRAVVASVTRHQRCLLAIASLLAYWPSLQWFVQRTFDPSDERWGLIPLLVLLLIPWLTGGSQKTALKAAVPGMSGQDVRAPRAALPPAISALVGMLLLTCAYCFSSQCPALIRAAIAVSALTCAVCAITGKKWSLACFGLGMLALPVIPSLQFYAGFPMRVLVTHAAAISLNAAGLAAGIDGTGLTCNGHYVGIDPACSGLKMLWTGLFIAFALCAIKGMNNKQTLLVAASSIFITVVCNIMRASCLFVLETAPFRIGALSGMSVPEWLHSGIGVVLFVLSALGIAFLSIVASHVLPHRSAQISGGTLLHCANVRVTGLLILMISIASLFSTVIGNGKPSAVGFVGADTPRWPAVMYGRKLKSVPLTAAELEFEKNFPGKIAKFTDGKHEILFRWVSKETRQLHSSQDCFRGGGFKTAALPCLQDEQSRKWSSFSATKSDRSYVVQERFYDAKGNSWTDISDWYWAAALGRSRGPWMAVTVATPTARGITKASP